MCQTLVFSIGLKLASVSPRNKKTLIFKRHLGGGPILTKTGSGEG